MTYKSISVIFTLEGLESNTEVHFFKGLSDHLSRNRKIYIAAIGKTKNSEKRKKDTLWVTKRAIRTMEDIIFEDNCRFYFIGDGDKAKQIEPMVRSKEIITKYLIEELKISRNNISNELIYLDGSGFDEILNNHPKIKKSNLFNSKRLHKKKTNMNFFNNVIDTIDENILINGGEKIKEVLMKIFGKTKYSLIINNIYN